MSVCPSIRMCKAGLTRGGGVGPTLGKSARTDQWCSLTIFFKSGSNTQTRFTHTDGQTDIQTDGDYIKRVVHGPPGDHTLKNSCHAKVTCTRQSWKHLTTLKKYPKEAEPRQALGLRRGRPRLLTRVSSWNLLPRTGHVAVAWKDWRHAHQGAHKRDQN